MTTDHMISSIRAYGLLNTDIFDAMRRIDRKLFVRKQDTEQAYSDTPLYIGHGQTISQPYTVAFMIEALELSEGMNVLEIGAGSGYTAALMQAIVKTGRVTAIEYISELAEAAKDNISALDQKPMILHGDGCLGYEKNAPYDRIIASCACPQIPPPWLEQLRNDGIILAPIGSVLQEMTKIRKSGATENLGTFAFVPLVGKYGK